MGVALITPFKEDESVDYEALGRLVDYQVQNGTDYLVVLGTTAETPTLTEEEKRNIIDLVVSHVRGRIPIVLGVGGNCTRNVVEQLKHGDFTGIDAILSVVPYYNKPSQEGIYQHYKAIANATKLPIILYNVPGRTGVNMTAETTLRIAREFENVVAVKEASGNITYANIREVAETGVDIISLGALTHSVKSLDMSFKAAGQKKQHKICVRYGKHFFVCRFKQSIIVSTCCIR